MVREISTAIVLENQNLVPGSEVVTIKGAPISALIRDSDYIIDYALGELRFLASGAAVEFSQLIEQNGIDVAYSYSVDFTDPSLFESQLEVFDEVATRVTDFRFQVKNGPLTNVSRVLNQTTQEQYQVIAISDNQVVFTGNQAPRTTDLERISTNLDQISFDDEVLRHVNNLSIIYPSKFTPELNPITEINQLQSTSKQLTLLAIGGEENLPTTISVPVSREAADIQLFTGGRTLKSSNSQLIQSTDYSFEFANTQATTDYKTLTIQLTPSAIQKIRTNNLYLNLAFEEVGNIIENNLFSTTTHHVNQTIDSTGSEGELTLLPRLVEIGPLSDNIVSPLIEVYDPVTKFKFEENIDYQISTTQKKITFLSTGRVTSTEVLIYYIEQRNINVSFTLISDVVLIDYVWSNNALNWSNLSKQVPVTENKVLVKDTQFITLTASPLDFNQVLIYLKDDFTKKPQSTAISYNQAARRLHIESIPVDGNYVIEYQSISQPVTEGSPYFVSYKYGATRDVLRNKFARMVGIDNAQTNREEVKALAGGTTSTQLSRSPLDLDQVKIFLEGDRQEVQVATATNFDGATRTLTFTSLPGAARYIFRYPTDGFDTKNLRTAVEKLYETFPVGPTLSSFENIISGFVSTPAEITTGLTNRFVLPSQDHTSGNQIAAKPFETSSPLDDGTESVSFLPARFNLGAIIESSKQGYVRAPASSNIGLLEGTLEFLTGVVFEVNDNKFHYFVDVMGDDPRKNRFSLYKSNRGSINFDIWDNKGQLFRAAVDVNQVYNTEIIQLEAGDNTAVLSFDATPAQLDLNDNDTPDLYDGLETKFIILPETPTFPEDFRRGSIKVLAYDPPTRTVTFEPVDFTGRYVFSYVGGLTKFEETENFIAATWKLHTHDGEPPFYRLYINGRRIINQTLENIDFTSGAEDKSQYDSAQYDIDVYEES